MGKHLPTVLSIRTPFGINGHDNTLAAKHFSGFPHKVWPAHGGSINRDLVSSSPEEVANCVGGVNPAANRQRHKDTLRSTMHHINDDLTLFMRGGNIEKD